MERGVGVVSRRGGVRTLLTVCLGLITPHQSVHVDGHVIVSDNEYVRLAPPFVVREGSTESVYTD